jgi:hypothetical protein
MKKTYLLFCIVTIAVLLSIGFATDAKPIVLANYGLQVEIDPDRGVVCSITNALTGEKHTVQSAPICLETTNRAVELTTVTNVGHDERNAHFTYRENNLTITVHYRIDPVCPFIEKIADIRNVSDTEVVLKEVILERMEFTPALQSIYPHNDPSQMEWLINLFLRDRKGGFYCGIETPIYRQWNKGISPSSSWLQLEYSPNCVLLPGESYQTDPSFLGAYRKEGVYVFKELGKLQAAMNDPQAIPSALSLRQEVLDWGEVWGMQDFMNAIQPPQEFYKPGYYVRAVAMVGGRRTGEMDPNAGFHIAFGPEHVAGSKAFVDEIAQLGRIPHIEWATEWFGVGGYTNPTPDLVLERAMPGSPTPVNPYWKEVVDYARSKGIRTGIFETVTRNFAMEKREWKVLQSDGTAWTWGDPAHPVNCWGNPDYAKWRLEITSRAIEEMDLYMVAWDAFVPADWTWLGWPDLKMECYATNHGHLPGDIRYAAYRNIQWFLDQLKERYPKVALRIASGATTAYPWIMKNLIEYHPNFYDGETGASFWLSYNFRFLPMRKSGILFSASTDEQFRWLLLRSISTSDHVMLWPDAVPLAIRNKAFWDRWLSWADEHIEYLRVGRTLFREPWGDKVVASMPPALEGRLPAPESSLHGTAHCIGDHGFLFVFNPSGGLRVGQIPVNHWLGLSKGDSFDIRILYPDDKVYATGICRGQNLHVAVAPASAMVLELSKSNGSESISSPDIPKDAPIDRAFLSWEDIPWTEIQWRP